MMLSLLLKSFDPDTITVNSIGGPSLIVSGIGILAVLYFIYVIQAAPKPSKEAQQISNAIQEGARAFLKMEYTALAVVVGCLFALVCSAVNWRTGICYLSGAVTSAMCGYIGMMVCTYSNAKTAAAAEHGLNNALKVSFSAGAVMGLTVVSVGLGALSVLLMAFSDNAIDGYGALAGFGMGCSTVSIFARVGGGIFTKAADVGADLVGKVEKDLPEDDARNPATIADNVGDNVGDVAGMGADLYSSFCGSIVASSLLGFKKLQNEYANDAHKLEWGYKGVCLPFWISMTGIIAAIIGILTIRTKDGATQRDLLNVLRRGILIAAIVQIGLMAAVIELLGIRWQYFGCIIIGLFCGMSIAIVSEYWTSYAWAPTKDIARAARVGPANVVIEGLSVGMFSDVFPTLMICGTMIASYNLVDSNYGIALASTGLLSTLGITLACDAYGPVADNAGGIAEMTHMPPKTRENTDLLDALGNTTAAIGKGFAVGSAVLTAVSLLSSYVDRLGVERKVLDTVNNDRFFAGALLGAMIPYWFAGMTMGAVNKAAQAVVVEVRRQFHEIPGLMEGSARADHSKCVTMITKGALHAMAFPALLTILSPIIIGVGMGPQMLQGLIVGCIVSGFMLGGMMSSAGGAWDNAKKFIESGQYGGKKSKAHKAAVVGDTIGDPFKDTSGPALNIVIKLVSYISVTLSSVWKTHEDYWWASLIVIGVLMIFVPLWNKITPEGMDGSVLEPYFAAQLKADAEAAEEGKQNPAPEGMMNGKSSHAAAVEEKTNGETGGEIELAALPELHWRIIDAEDS